jgi:hypothetical protein
MRGRIASIAAALTLLGLLTFFFLSSTQSSSALLFRNPSRPVSGYPPYKGRPEPLPWNPPKPKDANEGNAAERLIIKVKLKNEDASWVQKLEPSWQNNVIGIESMYSHAHPKAHRPDKGRVASAYLTWIIENYNILSETLVFLPPRDTSEKTHFGFHNILINLQIPYIQETGFANLRCPTQKSQTTCNDKALKPTHPPYELRTLEAKIPKVWETLFGNHTEVPQQIATVLGAAFAVSKAQVQKRSVDDYLKYWTWLNRTIMDDDSSGLLMEYLWPVVFGKEAIFCPEPSRCECDLHGRCDGV